MNRKKHVRKREDMKGEKQVIKANRGSVTIKGEEATVKAEFATIIHAVAKSGLYKNENEAKESLNIMFEKLLDNDTGECGVKRGIMNKVADFFVSLF